MAAVWCKRNSEGRTLSSRQAHESQVKIPRFHIQYLNVHSSKYEIVLNIEGRRRVHLPRYSERTGHPPRWEEGLPTFTLAKLVPGGIAEISP